MLLSVIIPVFGVEKYIEKCVLSVVENNLENTLFEIIVIDDESPDNSVSIVKELIKVYPLVRLVRQKNRGLSGARNRGIEEARGRYVLFLDGDDYLKKNALRSVVNKATSEDLDILEFGAVGVTDIGEVVYQYSQSSAEPLSGFNYLSGNDYMNSACNKLYSLNFLLINKLRFKEGLYIEDYEFNTRAFFFAKRVLAVNNILGCFVQTSNSITRNSDRKKHQKMVEDISRVVYMVNAFRTERGFLSNIEKKVFDERLAFLAFTLAWNLIKLRIDKTYSLRVLDKLESDMLYPIKLPLRSKKKNIAAILVNIKPVLILLFFIRSRKMV